MRICLYGGPGIGKSTTAAKLFTELKKLGVNIELVTEYVKTWAWEDRKITSYDQVYIFGKQLRAEDLLVRKGVNIITDSPLLLQLAYSRRNKDPFVPELLNIHTRFTETHPAFNILLRRTVPYSQHGRYETAAGAIEIDNITKDLLHECGYTYINVAPGLDDSMLLAEVRYALLKAGELP